MEIVISTSKQVDNKFDARIGVRKQYHLDRKGHHITPNIKITQRK